MKNKMPPFRRKKSGKSFPVKVCTLDAELEFNLEVRQVLILFRGGEFRLRMFRCFGYSGEQLDGICSIWYAELSALERLGTLACSTRTLRDSFPGSNWIKKVFNFFLIQLFSGVCKNFCIRHSRLQSCPETLPLINNYKKLTLPCITLWNDRSY